MNSIKSITKEMFKNERDKNEKAEKEKYPYYSLKVVFAPEGLEVTQFSEGIDAYRVIGALDVIKNMHSSSYAAQLIAGINQQRMSQEAEKLTPEQQEKLKSEVDKLMKTPDQSVPETEEKE